jgi:hypothetical protein
MFYNAVEMLKQIQQSFRLEKVLYTKHARDEMEVEEFGEIREQEVYEAILNGRVIETYPEDEPYPSCLVFGRTAENRPLHIICAHASESDIIIIITVYQPDPEAWDDLERRKQ